MAVKLEGNCSVRDMREGAPIVSGTLSIWPQIGRHAGAEAISLRVLEFEPGLSPGVGNEGADEVIYFLDRLNGSEPDLRRATVFIDGWSFEIGPQTGIYLRPGQTFTVNNLNSEPIIFVSSQCPEPQNEIGFVDSLISPKAGSREAERIPIVRLVDRESIPTADRWYRVLVDDEVGSLQVTQFVGSIPPGRAPDHFHNYEEVLFILRGEGLMRAGEAVSPIGPGSCVYLPKRQVHCVENTGSDELRLLGCFYPAGSPSARYES